MAISFEQDLNLNVIERVNYSFLDFLSDVGGLNAVITTVSMVFLSMLNYNKLNVHVVQQLYKFKPNDSRQHNSSKAH